MEWLKYCLRSIKKNWDMSDGEVVVCFPNSEYDRLKGEVLLDFPWVRLTHWSDSHKEGYIDQQINKLHADLFCQGEYIVFCDSDCFLTKKGSFKDFFRNKKPIWLHTDYNKVGDAICWKEPTERAASKTLTREYMRRIPIVVKREHLKLVRDYVSLIQGEFIPYMSRLDRISEFNLMGAVLHELKTEDYFWIDTDDEVPKTNWVQDWSWQGMTEDKKKHLEGMLK
jgi:hypothetical protein